ncbi:hypothetical protein EVA_13276 [gut metagenome]|uniref:Uncharacterized protein n=1 Tax=gut metagenome TaxID=749906 RepID=J9GGV9_9ZZZZ
MPDRSQSVQPHHSLPATVPGTSVKQDPPSRSGLDSVSVSASHNAPARSSGKRPAAKTLRK